MPNHSRPTVDKFETVIQKNTFYFYNSEFENTYEGHINSIREALSWLRAQLENQTAPEIQKQIVADFLSKKSIGLTALLALTGFSNESLKRLITLIRVVDNKELSVLTNKPEWYIPPKNIEDVEEWSDDLIARTISEN